MQESISTVLSYIRNYYPSIRIYCSFQSAYIEKQLTNYAKEGRVQALHAISCYQLRKNIFSLALINDGAISLFYKLMKHSQSVYSEF